MAPGRLKSSFIYLANAVHDMTGNWTLMSLVLAPMVVLASLCLLPDALNLQHQLVHTFEPGTESVGWHLTQAPYAAAGRAVAPLFPVWVIRVLRVMFALISYAVDLVVLCTLARAQARLREASLMREAVEIYRRVIELAPSFLWIALLQALATVIGFVLLVVPGFLAYIWLYFAEYALVFDNRRSWPALLQSRELIRGRFFKVALRVVVFLAVWSGFNSWSSGIFVGLSLLLDLLAIKGGAFWLVVVFAFDLSWICVTYATTAFFFAAGVRLYQDLQALEREGARIEAESAPPPTGPLNRQVSA